MNIYKIELKNKFKDWDQDHAHIVVAKDKKNARIFISKICESTQPKYKKYWLSERYSTIIFVGVASKKIKDKKILLTSYAS